MSAEREAILALLARRRPGTTICPSEAARALAGDDDAAWRPLMPAVREAAAALADEEAVGARVGEDGLRRRLRGHGSLDHREVA